MPLPLKSAPVLVIARTPYDADPDKPMVWTKGPAEGQLIEKIVVITDDGMTIDNLTLDPSVNGEASVGNRVSLTIALTSEAVAVTGRDGRPRVGNKTKLRVLDVELVK